MLIRVRRPIFTVFTRPDENKMVDRRSPKTTDIASLRESSSRIRSLKGIGFTQSSVSGVEFELGNGAYCYPLTVTDHASRFILMCEALSSTREELAFTAFERLFKDRGLPKAIRSDNGVPFACAHRVIATSCSD